MENRKLLMRICSNAFVVRDVSMVHSMCLLKFLPYIYGGEPPKSMKLPMDSSPVTQSFFPLLCFPPYEGGEVMEGGFQKSLQLFVAN